MNCHESFYVFPRMMKSGKKVYYYQAYDDNNILCSGKSTGQRTKAAASEYCRKLEAQGMLVPLKSGVRVETLNDYAVKENLFVYDKCAYIQSIIKRGGSYSKYHAYMQRHVLNRYILPDFGKKDFQKITDNDIDKWVLSFPDKGLSNATGNNALKVLKVIFKRLRKERLINDNPAIDVRPLANNYRQRDILNLDELKRLFAPESIKEVWKNNIIIYTGCMVAGLTGMRLGEVLAIQAEDVRPDYIHVYQSYSRKGYGLKSTKTGKSRKIPIPDILYRLLLEVKKFNGSGFLFAPVGITENRPYDFRSFNIAFNKALNRIGIGEEERNKRFITIHSLRHGLNTFLRERGLPDSQVMAITGHSTNRMLERYSHIDLTRIDAVKVIQASLI